MKMKRFTSLFLAGMLGVSVAVALNSCGGGHHDDPPPEGPFEDIDPPAEDNKDEEQPANPVDEHPLAGKTFTATGGDCSVDITFPEALATATPDEHGEQWATGTATVVVHGVTYNSAAFCYCDYTGGVIWGGFELDMDEEKFVNISFGMKDDGTYSLYVEYPKMEIYDSEGGYPETIMFETYGWR